MANKQNNMQQPKPKPVNSPNGYNGFENHHPKQRNGESVQAHPGMTAVEIQRQILQATEMKLENKGVNKTVNDMNRMVTHSTPDFLQQQRESDAAVAAAAKAHDNDKIMRDSVGDVFRKAVSSASLDDAFIKPVPKKPSQFGMGTDKSNSPHMSKKILSASQQKPQRPQNAAVDKSTGTDVSDVVQLGTSEFKNDIPSVFFVPNLRMESERTNEDINLSRTVSNGQTRYTALAKMIPVVYLKDNAAENYNQIDIPGVSVKDGYKQISAYEYASDNGIKLSDMIDRSDVKNPSLKFQSIAYTSGDAINDFATSENTIDIKVPVMSEGNNSVNAYAYAMANNLSVDKIFNDAYAQSIETDKKSHSGIYDDMAIFHQRCVDKQSIMKNASLDDSEKERRIRQLDSAFVEKQKRNYENSGLDDKAISHLEDIGYIGIDAIRFKTHIADIENIVDNMKSINHPDRQIVDGAGKFTISSNSKDTDFGQYLLHHKDDIINYVGDKLGLSDDESKSTHLYLSTPSSSDGVTTSVLVYDGFCGDNVDDTIRKTVCDLLAEYGDTYVQLGNKTYGVEQGELDYCNTKYGSISAPYAVPAFENQFEKIESKPKQTTLDSELSVGYDIAADEYYANMAAQQMDMM